MTSAATLTLLPLASNLLMGPMPTRPALRESQVSAAVLPTGEMAPRPVMATLCSMCELTLPILYMPIPPSTGRTAPVT